MTNAADPLVGSVLDGRYEVQQRIGEGGMGVVYRARQLSIDRIIALKMLNPHMAADPTWVQRFYNEAKACSRLQHPNTIRMFDFGQTGEGRLYMSMEFLDGMSLRAALQYGALAPQRVVKILIQCCASLAEAHAIGIIHRDIKPDNVFLLNMPGSPDFVKLLDFSVAKLLEGDRMKTQAGVVFGTPQYMSPEQARALPLDARSDLYALGVLAFEMLSGMVPFHDDNPMTVIQLQLNAAVPPLPPAAPYSVQQIVHRAMEKDPARRYQSASEMMQHCQQVFAELAGGVAVGAGGMPRTMMSPAAQAPGASGTYPVMSRGTDQRQATPQPQPMAPNAPTSPSASSRAETMIANNYQQPYGYAPMQQGYPQAQMPSPMGTPGGSYPPATMQQQQQPQQVQQGYPYPQTYPVAEPGSYPQRAQSHEHHVPTPRNPHQVTTPPEPHAATTLFWIVSMLAGIALGVLAYVIVVQVSL